MTAHLCDDEVLPAVHSGGFNRRKPRTILARLSLESVRTLQQSLDVLNVNSRLVSKNLPESTGLSLFSQTVIFVRINRTNY